MLRKKNQLLAVFCILVLVIPGCAKKHTLVSAGQQPGKNAYRESSPKSLADQIRSVFKISEINRWAKKQAEKEALIAQYPELSTLLAQTEQNSSDLVAKRALADFYLQKKLHRRALEVYEELAGMQPEDADIQYALAQLWSSLGERTLAVRHALNATELNPGNAKPMLLLGRIYLFREQPEQAARALMTALELEPTNTAAMANLGFAYLEMERWQEAASYLRQALESDPSLVEARNNLGIAKTYLGDESGALKEFLRVNTPAAAYNNLGATYLAQKKWDKARDAFLHALSREPGYVKARLNLMEAESYLPPANVVDLGPFTTSPAWLNESWKRQVGITGDTMFEVPQWTVFSASQTLRFPLQRIAVATPPTPQNIWGETVIDLSKSGSTPGFDGPTYTAGASPPTAVVAETHSPQLNRELADVNNAPVSADSLAEMEPLPFTIEDSGTSGRSDPSDLEALRSKEPVAVEKASWDDLLARAVDAEKSQVEKSTPDLNLGGGDLLSMVVKRPGFDWTAIAQARNGQFEAEESKTQTPSSQLADQASTFYPAQVWLVSQQADAPEPVTLASRVVAPAETVAHRAPARSFPAPRLPFQLSSALPAPPPVESTTSVAVPPVEPELTAEDLEDRADVAVATDEPRTVASTAGAARRVVAEPRTEVLVKHDEPRPLPERLEQEPAQAIDQFSAVRNQIVDAQQSLETFEPEADKKGKPLLGSGTAGLLGVAMILIFLGGRQLFVRWRSPAKRTNTLDLADDA